MTSQPPAPAKSAPQSPKSKHTRGPWRVSPEDQAESPWVIVDAEGGSIASCDPCGPWMPIEEADANARLIAAAPNLLAVAEAVIAYAHAEAEDDVPGELYEDMILKARAAIAKVKGESDAST